MKIVVGWPDDAVEVIHRAGLPTHLAKLALDMASARRSLTTQWVVCPHCEMGWRQWCVVHDRWMSKCRRLHEEICLDGSRKCDQCGPALSPDFPPGWVRAAKDDLPATDP